jgi:putative transposase
MVAFIDDHREQFGVEPICGVLPIAQSTYFKRKAEERDPRRRSTRAQQDAILRAIIQRIWNEHHQVWAAEGLEADGPRKSPSGPMPGAAVDARDGPGRRGTRSGVDHHHAAGSGRRSSPRPGRSKLHGDAAESALGVRLHVRRDLAGFCVRRFCDRRVCRRIVGWRVSSSLVTDFVLDALEQAIYDRGGQTIDGLVHHSDRGTQYLSMRYTDRLRDAGIAPSVGSRGDSYDNALAESIIGLFKTEVIRRRGPWRHLEAVEFATLEWADWFNHRRLLEPIGYVPPAEYEARYYEQAAVA